MERTATNLVLSFDMRALNTLVQALNERTAISIPFPRMILQVVNDTSCYATARSNDS